MSTVIVTLHTDLEPVMGDWVTIGRGGRPRRGIFKRVDNAGTYVVELHDTVTPHYVRSAKIAAVVRVTVEDA